MSKAVVSDLLIYPVKSVAGISMTKASVLTAGLAGDRRYLITKPDGTFVTGRTHPKITAIKSVYHGALLTLNHEDKEPITLTPESFADKYQNSNVWGTDLIGQECGPQADGWISDLLGEPMKLLYFGNRSERFIKQHPENDVGFADGFPLLITAESSLGELNRRLLAPVSMANFRPNITVSGTLPFEEDGWSLIRIGDVRFELPKPCSRCVFTTVDPFAHAADKVLEPLKTLTEFRQVPDGKDVIFGENMIPLNTGTIQVGNPVEILKTKSKPHYVDNWAPKSSRITAHLKPGPAETFDQNPILLRCVQVIDETKDVKTFKFTSDPVKRFSYRPGQFLTLHIPINGEVVSRCYTISSTPSRPDTITITVKRVKGGRVSNWLHDHVAVGSSVEAMGPAGVFHLEDNQKKKILMISGGSGITPMLSMTRFIADTGLDYDVHFHHSGHTIDDLIAWSELSLLSKQFPGLELSYNTTQGVPSSRLEEHGIKGRISPKMLKEVCPDYLERDVFVCGPDQFMTAVQNHLKDSGLPEDQYNQESFTIEPTLPPEDGSTASYSIHFSKSRVTAEIKGNQAVLDAAEAAGIDIPYSCRSGLCGTCKSELKHGEITAPNAMALSEEDTKNNLFLACCSFAKSDIEVDL